MEPAADPALSNLALSLSQREVWLDQRAWPASTHLNIGGCGFLGGRFDLDLLRRALTLLVAQNDALRLAPLADGRQRLLAPFAPTLEMVDISQSDDPRRAMREWWQQRNLEPYAFDGTPPWRIALLRAHDELHGVSLQFHHLVMDGWGSALVLQRWSDLYNQLLAGTPPIALANPSYLQFIEESNAYRASEAFARDAAYWSGQLAQLPAPLIERRFSGPNPHALSASRVGIQNIALQEYNELVAFATSLGSTAFNFFLAAVCLYFARTCGRQEIVVGVPCLNRGGRRYRETPGMFVGVLVLNIKVDPDMRLSDLVSAVGLAMRGALRHPRYPLSELGRSLEVIRSGRDGLFDVMLSFERQGYDVNFGTAHAIDSGQMFSGIARYPLGVTVCEFLPAQDVALVLDGSVACFAEGEVELLGRRFWHLVQTLMARPQLSVRDVAVLPPLEQQELLFGLHRDVPALEPMGSFAFLVERQAGLRPSATALVWDGGSMDYRSLDRRANHLAQRLVAFGVARESLVAIAIGRSADMVIAMLAVAKSGAAFLPLDPDAPVARLAGILQESAATCLLIQEHSWERMAPLHGRTLVTNWGGSPLAEQMAPSPPASPAPQDLAYVLFTSGSSGRPKGVMVEHGTLLRRLAWLSRTYQVEPSDRSAQATQVTFDPSLIELFLPLINGASVALPPPGRLRPETLADFAIKHGVTIMAFVPSTLAGFLEAAHGSGELKLRVACCGGEVLSAELANRYLAQTGGRLFNVYGPTEAAIFATAWACRSQPAGTVLPIGRPIDDTLIYVLDAQLQPVPFGVPGEVFIGGQTLARGYLNRPERTADAFVPDPWHAGARMYRTGDRGWLGVDGDLHFIGRADRQIKLRGYRIELGEIEAALMAVEGVTQAAVKLAERRDKPVLYAWVSTTGDHTAESLQRVLRVRLPDYMIPAAISVLPELPVSHVGKIDYAALPEPQRGAAPEVSREPATALERELLALWEDVLDMHPLHVQDNFFDIGGDSLAAVTILTGIERMMGRKVPLYLLTEHPTVERLAQVLEGETASPELMMRLGAGSAGVPLYLAASGHGDLLRFQTLAHALEDACELHMLQPPLGDLIESTSKLAALYADRIQKQSHGPGYVAGFSVGGIAALETACLLEQRGHSVRGLILIDTIYPKKVWGGTAIWRTLGWLVRRLHVQDLSMNGRRLGAMFSDAGLVGQVMAMSGYRPSRFGGRTMLIKTAGLARWDSVLFGPWRRLLGEQMTQHQIAGLHGSIFETGNTDEIAALLAEAVDARA